MTSKEPIKVSYLGIPGSFSHRACVERFPGGHYSGLKDFEEVVRAADAGEADYAILPVENSSAGRVTEVYNLMPTVKLQVVGEFLLPIHHSIMVSYKAYRQWLPQGIRKEDIQDWKASPLTDEEKKAALSAIREVHSHSQALMQCSSWLKEHLPGIRTSTDFDTATAAQALARLDTKDRAVIASSDAADIYSLMLLAENIEDDPYNMTRFLIFGKEPLADNDNSAPFITSLIFQTNHVPGALLKALQTFAEYNINLTKLETYMVSQQLPNPTFYVDAGVAVDDSDFKNAMEQFREFTTYCHILGSYPASPHRGQKNSFLPVK